MSRHKNVTIKDLYSLKGFIAKDLLSDKTYPWEVLPHIGQYILSVGPTLWPEEYDVYIGEDGKENVWIAKTATIEPDANIYGPAIIGPGTEIRHNAFIRGNVIIGENCVIGNATEIKNSVIMDNVELPHYNYIGDSVIGSHSHLGAGAIISNLKSNKTEVYINQEIPTKLLKVGAFLGDYVEIGCNSVLNPGTVIGKNSTIYPVSCIRGIIPENSIVKTELIITTRSKKE